MAAFFLLAVGFVPSEAGAKAPRFVTQAAPKLRSAVAGQQTIRVSATTRPGATCKATVSVKKVRQSLSKAKATKKGRISWRWQILPTSPSGTWKIKVSCSKSGRSGSSSRSVLIITSSKSSTGAIGDPQSLSVPDGEVAGLGGSECGPFNAPPLKQCTCLAWQKRRDVYDTSVAKGVPRGGSRAAGSGYYVWDGGQWLVNAQRGGFPTGSQPVAGALVVWGVPNSASYGHVAYVEKAESPTRILLTECNYDWNGSCRTLWMNPQAKASLQGYIYGGPAGNGQSGGSTTPGGSLAPPGAPTGGLHFTYFEGNDGSLRVSHWTGSLWQTDNLGQSAAAASSPSAYLADSGTHFVYFVGSDGSLRVSHWTGNAWQNDNLGQGVQAGTSPSAYLGDGGSHFVYFVGNDGSLRVSHWTGSTWQTDNLGQGVRSGSSPTAYRGASGTHFVYFVGNDGSLRVSHWTGSKWQTDNLGQGVQGGSSPSAYLGDSGTQFVYFVGNDGSLRVSHWTGSKWQTDNLGQGPLQGTSPSAYRGANGAHFVYFVGNDGSLRVSHWTGSQWQTDNLSQGPFANTSPSSYLG